MRRKNWTFAGSDAGKAPWQRTATHMKLWPSLHGQTGDVRAPGIGAASDVTDVTLSPPQLELVARNGPFTISSEAIRVSTTASYIHPSVQEPGIDGLARTNLRFS